MVYLSDNPTENPHLKNMVNITYEIKKNKPRAMQVWKCDDIEFDSNGKWHKVVYNYKSLPGKCVWKGKTGERKPF